jgi:hypothetical protein
LFKIVAFLAAALLADGRQTGSNGAIAMDGERQ